MTKICIELENCFDCPFVISKRCHTADSWEYAEDYFCKEVSDGTDYKKIAGYIEWPREMPEVPDWCPHRLKENNYV